MVFQSSETSYSCSCVLSASFIRLIHNGSMHAGVYWIHRFFKWEPGLWLANSGPRTPVRWMLAESCRCRSPSSEMQPSYCSNRRPVQGRKPWRVFVGLFDHLLVCRCFFNTRVLAQPLPFPHLQLQANQRAGVGGRNAKPVDANASWQCHPAMCTWMPLSIEMTSFLFFIVVVFLFFFSCPAISIEMTSFFQYCVFECVHRATVYHFKPTCSYRSNSASSSARNARSETRPSWKSVNLPNWRNKQRWRMTAKKKKNPVLQGEHVMYTTDMLRLCLKG